MSTQLSSWFNMTIQKQQLLAYVLQDDMTGRRSEWMHPDHKRMDTTMLT